MNPACRCVALLLAAGAVLPPIESQAGLSAGECAGLSIQVEDVPQAISTECGSRNIGGGGDQGSGKRDVVQVLGPAFVFVVSHASVGHRTYLVRLGVRDVILNYPVFEATDGWGDEVKRGAFTIRRFEAKLAGGLEAACFGFTRFSGHVAGTTGYRHLISGYYCDFAGSPPTEARIDDILSRVRYDF
jgi:hypothetical protein